MLARNFNRPAKINDAEFEALIRLLGMFERAEFLFEADPMQPTNPNGFNIAVVDEETDCGTSCCIVGWARRLCRDRTCFDGRKTDEWAELIMPRGWRMKDERFTVEASAGALRNYLTFGEPRWAEIVPNYPQS
jgi:hypothetical protein